MNATKGHTHPAVLLLVFNRPESTQETFEAIRAARPQRLYIACDGPRENHPLDNTLVSRVHTIANSVDWSCKVKTLLRTDNRGCRRGPSEAINWFFESEIEGIILEDDCVASPDFFVYCEYMLNTYREDKSIWHIGGNNFGWIPDSNSDPSASHYFGSLAQVWGWATWRDRWQKHEMNPFFIEENLRLDAWKIGYLNKLNKLADIELLKSGLDAWDYQWQVTILNNSGLAICPNTNLISNIGDGPCATHTCKNDGRHHLPTGSWSPPASPQIVVRNMRLDSFFASKMGLNSLLKPAIMNARKAMPLIKKQVYKLARSLIKRADFSIVIASTGRAGSTMLYDAIANSWVDTRKPGILKIYNRLLVASIQQELWRLADKKYYPGIIYKTHDAPPSNISDLDNVRFIFVYADPLDSALSVMNMTNQYGEIWLDEHLYHLSGHGNIHDLFQKDVLNYEKLLVRWQSLNERNVLVINYADLWDKQDVINNFLGFSIKLPQQRSRNTYRMPVLPVNSDLFSRLRSLQNNTPDTPDTT
jgi:hypothetical protein